MLSGKILQARGWPQGKVTGLAKAAGQALEDGGLEREATLDRLDAVRAKPGDYLADPLLADLARECIRRQQAAAEPVADTLRDQPLDYAVWGEEQIDRAASEQMR
ncbi:MAG TPA: hypothetical protein VFU88_17145, partial [Ktedonobacterales bacterium]|nr:hypothetical protein [Ktedonobacterales bacterium]